MRSYTKARSLSASLLHPSPTAAVGAAVNVGAYNVFIDPVAVYVGNKVICAAEYVGKRVGGGKEWEDAWSGLTVPAPSFKGV
jgi:hypothetical protein